MLKSSDIPLNILFLFMKSGHIYTKHFFQIMFIDEGDNCILCAKTRNLCIYINKRNELRCKLLLKNVEKCFVLKSNNSILDSSFQNMLFQKSCSLSLWPLVKLSLTHIYILDSKGFLFAYLPCK